jgi:hypothetical protein
VVPMHMWCVQPCMGLIIANRAALSTEFDRGAGKYPDTAHRHYSVSVPAVQIQVWLGCYVSIFTHMSWCKLPSTTQMDSVILRMSFFLC